MKKKILFFLYALSGGGAERTVINIINNLDKEKFEMTLILGTDRNNDYIDLLSKNVRIKVLRASKLRYSILKLRKAILDEKPDILFSTINGNNIVLLLAKVLTFKNIKTIVRESNNRTESGKVTKLNKLWTFFTYNLIADRVVALSKGVKEDLKKNFNIKSNKIQVIYNPIEVDTIKFMSMETVNDWKKSKEEKVIITVGRLVEQKDFKTLLKAFKIVSNSLNVRLIIVGKGELEEELKSFSKKLGINNKVDFLGFKKNPYKYMKQADLFVMSSKWEGFGHVITEAMAVGLPVVSTNCKSGPSEILGNDEFGLLTPVGNLHDMSQKIIILLKDYNKMQKYKNVGFDRVSKFDVKTIVTEYENLFIKVGGLRENNHL